MPNVLLTGSVFLRREALAAGYDKSEIQRLLERGEWQKVRWGAYCLREVWLRSDARARHLLAAQAVSRSLVDPPTLSHSTAAMAWGLPDWGHDLCDVHVTRPPKTGRREAGVVHHSGELGPEEQCVLEGLLVTSPTRTVLDCAGMLTFDAGVAMADAALHAGLTTLDQLREALERRRDWAGAASAARVVEFADGRAESVGESRLRVGYARQGLPRAVPQVPVRTRIGVFHPDLLIEELMVASEFDGDIKYRPANASVTNPASVDRAAAAVVLAEKRRENALREAGVEVVRVIWAELDDEAALAEQVRAAGRLAMLRHGREAG